MKAHELIYINTVIPYFLSCMESKEEGEREMKVKNRTLEMWEREDGSKKK